MSENGVVTRERTAHDAAVPSESARCAERRKNRAISKVCLASSMVTLCCAVMAYCRLVLKMTIVCTHFAYVPIVFTGMWWGKRSILVAALLGLFIACLRPFVAAPEAFSADLARVFFFILVAVCVSTISERAAAARKELEAAQNQLVVSERLASVGQLSAGLAHEPNNPLGTILLYSHVLLNELDGTDQHREDVQMIVSEATRCKNIVCDLLDFARESRVSKAPADLATVIRDVVAITAAEACQAGVEVTTDIPSNLPEMMIDGAQIKQMLVNLVQNSLDAVSGTGQVRISAYLVDSSEWVEIKVKDNGCGIPRENLSKVFDPFFTTKEMGKGTGLGLAIAYGIVKMHSGDISVESELGKGTIFTIRLPLSKPQQSTNERAGRVVSPADTAAAVPSLATGGDNCV